MSTTIKQAAPWTVGALVLGAVVAVGIYAHDADSLQASQGEAWATINDSLAPLGALRDARAAVPRAEEQVAAAQAVLVEAQATLAAAQAALPEAEAAGLAARTALEGVADVVLPPDLAGSPQVQQARDLVQELWPPAGTGTGGAP